MGNIFNSIEMNLLKIILEEEFNVRIAFAYNMGPSNTRLIKMEYASTNFKYEVWTDGESYFLKYKGIYHILSDELVSVLLLKSLT